MYGKEVVKITVFIKKGGKYENEEEDTVSFVGTSAYSEGDRFLLDEVSLTADTNEGLDEAAGGAYAVSGELDDLVFCFNAELVDDDGNVIDTEEIVTEAIITENGGLDACIEIGDEHIC